MVDKNEILKKFVIGACSGPVEVSFSHVADVIKTVNQSRATNGRIESIGTTISSIYKNNGFRGFYTGFLPRVIGIVPMRAVFWGSMYSASTYYSNHFNDNSLLKKALFMGTICGISQSIVDTPIEVAKIYLIERVINNRKTIEKKQSMGQLMKGYVPTTMRNTGFAIIMSLASNYSKQKELTFSDNFFLMGASGALASYATQPLDTWKTYIQSQNTYKSLRLNDIYHRKQGVRDFYRVVKNSNSPFRVLFKGGHTRALMAVINMSIGGTLMMFAMAVIDDYEKYEMRRLYHPR